MGQIIIVNMPLVLIPSQVTCSNMDAWVKVSLVPCQQRLKNRLNQKAIYATTKTWDGKNPAPPIPIKKEFKEN